MKKQTPLAALIFLMATDKKRKSSNERLADNLLFIDVVQMAKETNISEELIRESFTRTLTPEMDALYKKPIQGINASMVGKSVFEKSRLFLKMKGDNPGTELQYFAIRSLAKMMYANEKFFLTRTRGIGYLKSMFGDSETKPVKLWAKLEKERIRFTKHVSSL
jgi:hypothetical protein